MDVNEQYGKFPNGNPEAHTGRGSVNSVGGVNQRKLKPYKRFTKCRWK